MSEDKSAPAASSTNASVLETIAKRLNDPALLFGLGVVVVLLMSAGLLTDNQAPLYVGAILAVAVIALAVWARSARTGSGRIRGEVIDAHGADLSNRKYVNATPTTPHTPTIEAKKRLDLSNARFGNEEVTYSDTTRDPATKDRPAE